MNTMIKIIAIILPSIEVAAGMLLAGSTWEEILVVAIFLGLVQWFLMESIVIAEQEKKEKREQRIKRNIERRKRKEEIMYLKWISYYMRYQDEAKRDNG